MGRYIFSFGILATLLWSCGDDDAVMDAGAGDTGICMDNAACDDGVFCNGIETCLSGVCTAGTPPCEASQSCDEGLEQCTGDCEVPDADGDGHASIACGGDDCDDTDEDRYPTNTEICDDLGHDEDCDETTVGDLDVDLDGFIDQACCNGDTCGADCADRLPSVGPGATEVCNLRDDDCDGNADEGVTVSLHPDEDGDLHGTSDAIQACAGFAGTSTSMLDCADDDITRHGAQFEFCDGQDNDCDPETDEAISAQTWYEDTDGDGFGNASAAIVQCERPATGYSLLATDCQPDNPEVHPAAAEQCNALDDNCDGFAGFTIAPGDTEDDDRDGHADSTCGGTDCDDEDPFAYVGAPELMDGVDNDCDGVSDEDVEEVEWFVDTDGDGVGDGESIMSNERQRGRVTRSGDCDDSDGARRVGALELCDGIDNDCDGETDEGLSGTAFYNDVDGDGFGDPATQMFACDAPAGFVDNPGDCNDADPLFSPGAPELCDMADNDCDDITDEDATPVDWYTDFDRDGYGTGPVLRNSCDPVPGQAPRDGDCDDMDNGANPGGSEVCNGRNDDCDGMTDEGVQTTYYFDEDGDGFGGSAIMEQACSPSMRFVENMDDCDDMDGNNFPGNMEVCDARDNNCMMGADEGLPMTTYFLDGDDDGFAADGAPTVVNCMAPMGYAEVTGDCNDMDELVYPDAPETCNGVNDDCDASIDETVAAMCSMAIHPSLAGQCLPPPSPANRCACVDVGTGDCDSNPGTGCETNITRDPRHCGSCGAPCGPTEQCSSGMCVPSDIIGLRGGAQSLCVAREGGIRQCWGADTALFGVGDVGSAVRVLADFDLIDHVSTRISSVGAGHDCLIAPSATGGTDVYCWGRNQSGQCGIGNTSTNVPAPTRILASVDDVIEDWVEVAAAGSFTYARRMSGEVYSWGGSGGGDSGQLGRPYSSTGDPNPGVVPLIDDAIDISANIYHTCAVRGSLAQAWCWGGDSFGGLGNGPGLGGSATPGPVVDVGSVPIADVAEVEVFTRGGCVRQNAGGVWCWGSGPLGNGATSSQYAVQTTGITGATDLACGRNHCCALTGGGLVQCWGTASQGQLGHGSSPTQETTPVAVQLSGGGPLVGAIRIATSDTTSCAQLPGNQVACWGLGSHGELGDGIISNHFRTTAGAPDFVMGL